LNVPRGSSRTTVIDRPLSALLAAPPPELRLVPAPLPPPPLVAAFAALLYHRLTAAQDWKRAPLPLDPQGLLLRAFLDAAGDDEPRSRAALRLASAAEPEPDPPAGLSKGSPRRRRRPAAGSGPLEESSRHASHSSLATLTLGGDCSHSGPLDPTATNAANSAVTASVVAGDGEQGHRSEDLGEPGPFRRASVHLKLAADRSYIDVDRRLRERLYRFRHRYWGGNPEEGPPLLDSATLGVVALAGALGALSKSAARGGRVEGASASTAAALGLGPRRAVTSPQRRGQTHGQGHRRGHHWTGDHHHHHNSHHHRHHRHHQNPHRAHRGGPVAAMFGGRATAAPPLPAAPPWRLPPGAPVALSVATLNLRSVCDRWTERKSVLKSSLREARSHIMAFQEVLTGPFGQDSGLMGSEYRVRPCRAALAGVRDLGPAGRLYAAVVDLVLAVPPAAWLAAALPARLEAVRELLGPRAGGSPAAVLARDLAVVPFYGNSVALHAVATRSAAPGVDDVLVVGAFRAAQRVFVVVGRTEEEAGAEGMGGGAWASKAAARRGALPASWAHRPAATHPLWTGPDGDQLDGRRRREENDLFPRDADANARPSTEPQVASPSRPRPLAALDSLRSSARDLRTRAADWRRRRPWADPRQSPGDWILHAAEERTRTRRRSIERNRGDASPWRGRLRSNAAGDRLRSSASGGKGGPASYPSTSPPPDASLPPSAGVWIVNTHLDHASPATRADQARAIVAWMDDRHDEAAATVLVGDLNAAPDEECHRVLRAAGFVSAHASVHGGEPRSTWPSGLRAPLMDEGRPEPLDYAYVRPSPGHRARVLRADLFGDVPCPRDPTLFPSDHVGLRLELELVAEEREEEREEGGRRRSSSPSLG